MLKKMLLLCALLLGTSLAQAESYHYEVQVEGMVCAYCAYSVSKRFQALPGVEKHSVVVDLKVQRVNFQSNAAVADTVIENALAESGFAVLSIQQHMGYEWQAPSSPGKELASVSLVVDVLDSELSTQLLDALGEAAAQQRGRFTIQAPIALETAILKPLLGGRQQVIPVDYVAAGGKTISVTLWVE